MDAIPEPTGYVRCRLSTPLTRLKLLNRTVNNGDREEEVIYPEIPGRLHWNPGNIVHCPQKLYRRRWWRKWWLLTQGRYADVSPACAHSRDGGPCAGQRVIALRTIGRHKWERKREISHLTSVYRWRFKRLMHNVTCQIVVFGHQAPNKKSCTLTSL